MYVIVRNEDGKFVAPPGQDKSYTSDLTKARIFRTKEGALAECCGNEHVKLVSELIRTPE